MKTILKKIICLTLSLSFFLLNGQVFAHKLPGNGIIPQEEINELNALAKKIQIKYKFTKQNIESNSRYIQYILTDGRSSNPYSYEEMTRKSLAKHNADLEELQTMVGELQTKMRTTYQKYFDALPEGTYLKKATTKYINRRIDTLFGEQKFLLDNFLNISDIMLEQPETLHPEWLKNAYFSSEEARIEFLFKEYAKDTRIRNLFLSDLAEQQLYYERVFTWEMDKLLRQLDTARASFNPEVIEFFSKKTHTAEELLEYFLKHGPEEQRSILFALKTTDRGVTTGQLIPYLRYYLKKTNKRLWKLGRFSVDGLTKTLSKLPYPCRIAYIDDALDFSPEIKAFREELRLAEKDLGKKILNRSALRLEGTFLLLGAALISLTVTKFVTGSKYNSAIPKMAYTKEQIDEGELIPLDTMIEFFTTERNEPLLAQDPVLMADVFETTKIANKLLDEAEMDLSVSEEDMGQITDEEGQLPADIRLGLNNFDYNKIFSDTGII